MAKMMILLTFAALVACAFAGFGHELGGETQFAHNVEHKHASSHQSFSQHHYHAVPVYVKHEDAKLLHHPIELGGLKHSLKVLHPETQHSHDHGATIENHRSEFGHGGHDFGGHGHALGGHGGLGDFAGHDGGHIQIEDHGHHH